jgi:electron transfer flavoprotein-quinone oxidoreductase
VHDDGLDERYRHELGFVVKNHRKLRLAPHLVLSPRIQEHYPQLVASIVERVFQVDDPAPKPGLRRIILQESKRAGLKVRDLVRDGWTSLRTFG